MNQPRSDFEEDYFNHGDDSHYQNYYESAKGHFEKYWIPFVRERAPLKAGRHLDVGCAYGLALDVLPEPWCSFGLDVSHYALTQAKSLDSSKKVVQAIGRDLPFQEGAFAYITLLDVVEHIPKKELPKLVERARALLEKGGRMVFSTPNVKDHCLVDPTGPFWHEQDPTHINYLSAAEIYDLCRDFDKVWVKGYSCAGYENTMSLQNIAPGALGKMVAGIVNPLFRRFYNKLLSRNTHYSQYLVCIAEVD